MSKTCENCGQPVLASDAICWHCGRKLPRTETPAAASEAPTQNDSAHSISLTAVIVYAALTAVILLATFLVMRSLGRRPLPPSEGSFNPPAGRETVPTESGGSSLSLSSDWRWLDESNSSQGTEFTTALAAKRHFSTTIVAAGAVEAELALMDKAAEGGPAALGISQAS